MAWRQQGARWARGAFGVVLAYAFLFQVIVPGFASDRPDPARMVVAADGRVLCSQRAGLPDHAPELPQADHSLCCVVCAVHSLAPILPTAAVAGMPSAAPAAAPGAQPGIIPAWREERREPRSSQGPPPRA